MCFTEKLKNIPEIVVFKHLPTRRCPELDDVQSFEECSLHDKFVFTRNDSTSPRVVKSTDTTTPRVLINTQDRRAPLNILTQGSTNYQKWIRQKTRDDMDAILFPGNHETLSKNGHHRCVSASHLVSADSNENPSPTMRRMMYYARKYASKDRDDNRSHVNIDEVVDDEGYGSKTPSEEKDLLKMNDSTSTCFVSSWGGTNVMNGRYADSMVGSSANTIGRFSYTHQAAPSKTMVYGDSEDENSPAEPTEPPRDFIIHNYGPRPPRVKSGVINRKRPDSSHASRAQSPYDNYRNLDDLKPMTMILRKISIQDSQDENKPNPPEEEPEAMYDLQTSVAKMYIGAHEQSDRANYPMACTSPEFKFSQFPRPKSRGVTRVRIDSAQKPKIALDTSKSLSIGKDILRRSHIPLFDFSRAQSSVCLPIGDLIPAAEKSIQNKSSSAHVVATEPPTKKPAEVTSRISIMDDPSLDVYSTKKSIVSNDTNNRNCGLNMSLRTVWS